MVTHNEEFTDDKILENRATAFALDHLELIESLVKIRKMHGLSQAEIATRMGISQPAVASFERYDSNPTLATIRRYALVVGATMKTIVEDACTRSNGWQSFDSACSSRPDNNVRVLRTSSVTKVNVTVASEKEHHDYLGN
ncbi:helix-turn-helix transcriptional regulator [Jonesiaceae bacterium BS-20]|uniref:Helix-turn-helix transcriptional regulator n=1 Tax=Jonesiaceae bacterium BS-20 TaxID=3120821 RepID=A0AAU7DYQ9_9MICO